MLNEGNLWMSNAYVAGSDDADSLVIATVSYALKQLIATTTTTTPTTTTTTTNARPITAAPPVTTTVSACSCKGTSTPGACRAQSMVAANQSVCDNLIDANMVRTVAIQKVLTPFYSAFPSYGLQFVDERVNNV